MGMGSLYDSVSPYPIFHYFSKLASWAFVRTNAKKDRFPDPGKRSFLLACLLGDSLKP